MTQSPTVPRLRLGHELRRLRLRAGRGMDEAADHVARAGSSISRMETGQVAISRRVLDRLCDLYEAGPEERAALRVLAAAARRRGWWHAYGHVLSPGLDVRLGLETEATTQWVYEPEVVPALLRTESYSRELLRAGPGSPSGTELDDLVAVGRRRREPILGPDAPALRVVLHEAALRQEVGGAETMHEQRTHLLALSGRGAVTLRVLPFAAGAHPAMGGGGFTVLSVPLGTGVTYDVAFVHRMSGDLHLDRPLEVDRHRTVFGRLETMALDPDASRALIGSSEGPASAP